MYLVLIQSEDAWKFPTISHNNLKYKLFVQYILMYTITEKKSEEKDISPCLKLLHHLRETINNYLDWKEHNYTATAFIIFDKC